MDGRTGCQTLTEVKCAGCGKVIMVVPDDTIDNAEPFVAYCHDCIRHIGRIIAGNIMRERG